LDCGLRRTFMPIVGAMNVVALAWRRARWK
jgi:hypothetical protein